jgi:phosphodiesterase/alkaline phosphatase D-like protein
MTRVITRAWLSIAVALLVTSLGCASRQAPWTDGVVLWMWSGALTSSSAIVKARVVGADNAVLDVRDANDARVALVNGRRGGGSNDVFTFGLEGLQPAAVYTYRVNEPAPGPASAGRLRTLPNGPGRVTLAFASCASTGSNVRVWDALREVSPDVFIHMGDFHYENITTNTPDLFRYGYERALASPRQGALYREVPIVYVWDDHDFGADDADSTADSSPAAHTVYREYVPHHPLAGGGRTPIYQAFTAGRVRVIVTDVRTAREPITQETPESRSLLGDRQREWLLSELESASREAALVVWVNVVPWITKDDEGSVDGWAPWAGERLIIANAIEKLGLTRRLIIVSGDAHMLALDDGTNSQYATGAEPPGPVVMHAAPLDRWPRHKGGPYSHGTSARNQQFGVLQVNDDGTTLRVMLSGRDRYNVEVSRMHLDLVCDAVACRPAPSDESP